MAALPTVPRPRAADHVWFELTGGYAAALRVLVRELGAGGATRALAGLARRQLTTDPFAGLPAGDGSVSEWLTRRQLGPVLLLDDTLQQDLGLDPAEARRVLGELIADVGARLLDRRFPALDAATWAAAPAAARAALARGVFDRLGNVAAADVDTTDASMAIDVRACRFVSLLGAAGRPALAPLFCAADDRYFARPGSPIRLARSGTLATGADRCDFRFSLASERPPPA
jgi:hypothetical protein